MAANNQPTMKALIIGAGAIGRGFLAPRLVENGIEISFADASSSLVELLGSRRKRTYQTATALEDGYEMLEVPYSCCCHINELNFEDQIPDLLFFCVGVKEVASAACSVRDQLPEGVKLKAIYSLENEPKTVEVLKEILGEAGPCFFCVPDVITSSSAPAELLDIDRACVASEVGEIYLEGQLLTLNEFQYDDEYVRQHWLAKKYLHNTPHAALAYLGAQKGYDYIHQAARDEAIESLVFVLVSLIGEVLAQEYNLTDEFLQQYTQKEIKRFRNKNLWDPIKRVARNPEVKLQPSERILFVRSLLEKYEKPLGQIDEVIRAALMYQGCDQFSESRRKVGLEQLFESVTLISASSADGQKILQPLIV